MCQGEMAQAGDSIWPPEQRTQIETLGNGQPGHQRRGRSHDGQCPPRRAGPEVMGKLVGQDQIGWTCMEP